MSADPLARGLAAQARAAAVAAPKPQWGNSVVAIGDSNTANASTFDRKLQSGFLARQNWSPNGIFSQLIAVAGGRLRALSAGVPANDGVNGEVFTVANILVARGGAGYDPTTISLVFDQNSGNTGSGGQVACAATPIIAGGAIVGATITTRGTPYAQAPAISVIDASGRGSGAILVAQLAGVGTFAGGGLNSEEIEAYVPLALATGARNIVVMAGTNDLNAGVPVPPHRPMTLERSKAALTRIARAIVAGGARPIMVFPPQRKTVGTVNQRYLLGLHRWFVEELPNAVPGTIVASAFAALTDGATDTWPADSFLPGDTLHTGPRGANAAARVIWDQIQAFFPGPSPLLCSPASDRYNVDVLPDGNLLSASQACMSAAATAPADAPWTGVKMAGLTLVRGLLNAVEFHTAGGTGTGTIAASIVPAPAPRVGSAQRLQIDVTGATEGEVFRVMWGDGVNPALFVQGAAVLQVGSVVRACLDQARFSGGMAGIKEVKFMLALSGGLANSPIQAASWGLYKDPAGSDLGPLYDGQTLTMPTREVTIPAGSPGVFGVTPYFDIVVHAGAAKCTVDLFGVSVRAVG